MAWTPLHRAAKEGSVERTVSLLTKGLIDINQRGPGGTTPLMYAACHGHSRVVRVLLNKGAGASGVSDARYSALHLSAQEGYRAVTKLLIRAGADLEAVCAKGFTPLHMAADTGNSEVVGLLIEAGANPNSRASDGKTPSYLAANRGHVDAIKVLLRAKADPLLAATGSSGELIILPLDLAAERGHLEVAHELIKEHGIEGCGGASGGLDALTAASCAENQGVEMMAMLTDAGVVDNGRALQCAVGRGREAFVIFLLQQDKWKASDDEGAAYLQSAMVYAIKFARFSSSRNVRLLVDAGVDATATAAHGAKGRIILNATALALTTSCLDHKEIEGKDATEDQLHSLEAIRRLLMRVEAVHAVSWLWGSDATSVVHAATEETSRIATTSTVLTSTLPILRRRAGRPRVLLAAMFRTKKL